MMRILSFCEINLHLLLIGKIVFGAPDGNPALAVWAAVSQAIDGNLKIHNKHCLHTKPLIRSGTILNI